MIKPEEFRILVAAEPNLVSRCIRTPAPPNFRLETRLPDRTAPQVELLEAEIALRERLREVEEILRMAERSAGVGIWDIDLSNQTVRGTPQFWRVMGLPATDQAVPLETTRRLRLPEDRGKVAHDFDHVLGNHAETFETEYRIRRPDGEIRWIFGRGRLIRDASGRALRYSGIDIDVTERKAGEVALAAEHSRQLDASRAQIKAIFDNSPDWLTLFRATPDGRFVYVDLNRATERAYGLSYDQIVGRTVEEILGPEQAELPLNLMRECIRTGANQRYTARRTMAGVTRSIDVMFVRVPEQLDGDYHIMATARDITERDEMAERLRHGRLVFLREEQLRLATEAAEIGLWDVDTVADTLFWPPRVKAMFGISPDVPVSMADFYAGLHPDDRERVSACYAAAADSEKRALYDVEYRTVGKEDRVIRWVAAKGRGVFDENGRCIRVIGAAIDITARRLAAQRLEESEAALRELNQTLERRVAEAVAEKMKVEEALFHTQKLEALGQLTGGVAHDFNNLLTVIIGNLDALGASLPVGKARHHIDAANRAAERGAMLTQQLLAYARRQRLSAGAIDVNLTIRGLDDLLRRTLGGLVEIEIRVAEDLWHAFIDPTQLEMAILNLAINARDAMPFGGCLQIEADNIPAGHSTLPPELAPGDYVRLRISDTGEGMTPKVLAKAMDPFFTTKEVGKGSGLGLSQVYGVVKQCGGAIKLESAPGEGTTVLIWVPRSTQSPAPDIQGEAAVWTSAPARRGIVLVVDDDADVRQIAVEILSAQGFHVEQAESGEDALRILQSGGNVDLAVVDYAMPRMSGVEFVETAREIQPHLPVIYVSGYADPEAIPQDVDTTIVKKPYRAAELLHAVERESSKRDRTAGSETVVPIRSGVGHYRHR